MQTKNINILYKQRNSTTLNTNAKNLHNKEVEEEKKEAAAIDANIDADIEKSGDQEEDGKKQESNNNDSIAVVDSDSESDDVISVDGPQSQVASQDA